MIRFYGDFGAKLLIALAELRRSSGPGYAIGQMARNLSDAGAGAYGVGDDVKHHVGQEIRYAIGNMRDKYSLLEDIINELGEQVQQRRLNEGSSDKLLIDQLVTILRMDHGPAILTGPVLKELRKALLLPQEQGALLTRLREFPLYCASCGSGMINGEGAAISTGGDDGTLRIFCYRCKRPAYVRCTHADCGTLVPVTSRDKFTKHFYCAVHTPQKLGAEAPPQEPELPARQQEQNFFRAFVEAQQAAPDVEQWIPAPAADAAIERLDQVLRRRRGGL